VSNESVPSLIDNLVTALYGEITKTVVNRRVQWYIPCDPNNTAVVSPAFPRLEGEGLLCYIIRVFQNFINGGSEVFSPFLNWSFTGNGSTTTYNLTDATALLPAAYLVYIDGVVQAPSNYTIASGNPLTIVFSTAIPNGSNVVIVCMGTASTGEISTASVVATGSTTPRTLANRFADVVNVLDYGADPTGDTDSADAIQLAINVAANGGIVFCPRGTYYIGKDLLIKTGITFQGLLESVGESEVNGQDPTKLKSALWVEPTVTIKVDNNSSLTGFVIINKALENFFENPKPPSAVISAVNAFAGTAVTLINSDCAVTNCLIGGFENGIVTLNGKDVERFYLSHLLIDCTNGLTVNVSADCSRAYGVHCWPWINSRSGASATYTASGLIITVTASNHGLSNGDYIAINSSTDALLNTSYVPVTVTGTNTFTFTATLIGAATTGSLKFSAPAQRSGTAFNILRSDGLELTSCFSYGWDVGYGFGSTGIFAVNCQADGAGCWLAQQKGFYIYASNTLANKVLLTNCAVSGVSYGVYVEDAKCQVQVNNSEFHGNDVHLQSNNHDSLIISNCIFNDNPGNLSIKKCIVLNNGISAKTNINGNIFNSGISAFSISANATANCNISGNSYSKTSTTQPETKVLNNITSSNAGGNYSKTYCYGNGTADIGYTSIYYSAYGSSDSPNAITTGQKIGGSSYFAYDGSNFIPVASFRTVTTGTISTGIIAGAIIWNTTDASGSQGDRVVLDSSGNWNPVTNKTGSLGSSSKGWNGINVAYGSTAGQTVSWTSGTVTPENNVTANAGSLYTYVNTATTAGTLYVKATGNGATGWVAK